MSKSSAPQQASPAEASWAHRARQLDRYRWKMLRERHGLPGSFLRMARDALVDFAVGVRARICLGFSGSGVLADTLPCDTLLLHSAPKSMALQRKNILIDAVRARGWHLQEAALLSPSLACAKGQLLAPAQAVPLRYLAYAAHAQWLVARYTPRVLINERNGSYHTPFLRLALAARDARLLHLAHATTLESSRRLGMNDYDYYGVFGHSSLVALQERPLRFGTSTVVLLGSYLADETYDLPVADPAIKTLLVLGVGPDREKEPGYLRTYELLRDWAQRHPEYRMLFKRHPRSRARFWSDAAERLNNVGLLDTGCTLAEAFAQASVVINIMSNAGIESGLAGRPVIHVNAGNDVDIFSHAQFFGPQVRDGEELSRQLQALEQDYCKHVEQARRFADYHLVYGSQGLAKTTQLIDDLLRGHDPERDFETFELPAAG
ncbi:capsule biosynthesis protein [Pseudomonas cannabina]|uniref:Capsule biosynthesis protein n=3 Tax=Pseudomonas syringae group TaxID=136849 RepID=A0A8T8C792_PSEYM|nr:MULTISPECIES: hypothetical protein [Pseudomonas syringae group]KPB69358.1 Uncharacterized protein AC507_1307 [Pseudomonas syringae pv. maculicola]MBM0138557.1 capsule biosynthesis protein [Pseudomonas cannabina pv. alisalensis]QHE99515.1 capsule biosynthesis protein [Pseudomonas syringae pv. maculicola str. ES4326]QQN21562.1 capsule biosynthesis protein [Pseudomonas cannabina pv. alisalensis]RMN80062.1 hypothetical protein ALQ53_00392 [Pseudomonas cannabina]